MLSRWIPTGRFIHTERWLSWEDKLLKDFVEHNGKRWTRIVQHGLPHRSPRQCQVRWEEKLNPDIKRGPFSDHERKVLEKAVEEVGVGRWSVISERYLPNRTFRRIANEWSGRTLKRGPWTPQEDQLLLKGVEKWGTQAWTRISQEYLPHRARSGLRARYREHLSPGIEKGPWTESELDLLLRRTIMFGQDWKKVAEGIRCRLPEQCRIKWINEIDPAINKEPWSEHEVRLLFERLIESKGDIAMAAREMPGRNRLSCRRKFQATMDDPALVVLFGKELLRTEMENVVEWRARVAKLVCRLLEEPVMFRVKSSGGLDLFKRGQWSPEEREKLNSLTQESLDWEMISKKMKRSQEQCKEQYERYFSKPNIKVGYWLPEEDEKLLEAIEEHGKNWQLVAKAVPRRTKMQCASRWKRVLQFPDHKKQTLSDHEKLAVWEGYQMFGPNWQAIQKTYLPNHKPDHIMRWWNYHKPKSADDFGGKGWAEEEDKTLLFAIQQSAKGDKISWTSVSNMMQDRTAKECRLRWKIKLDPSLKKGRWESEEKMRLIELVQKEKLQKRFNSIWPIVTKQLGTGRSEHACRNVYYSMQRKGSRFAT
ncbi:DNA binding transcription coactivator transcription factor [Rhizopus stolonifer]|uniref:DNA binding transcription coactivator transcription factor n=1 Tax=Rhizopus stolonifer TaxID=4846 RepID=A0A367KLZ7_RHIST|nr:DNA binding transcription coactivator transcription factor [Rhizopus stolonifer]